MDRSAVVDTAAARYDEDALLYDQPHVLISRPFCALRGSDPLATEIAADSLSLLPPSRLDVSTRWFTIEDAEQLVETLQSSTSEQRMTAIAWCYHCESASVVAHALDIAAAAPDSTKSDRPNEQAPTYRVTPTVLLDAGLSTGAIHRLADRYGWIETSDGWQGGFLPLQLAAVRDGPFHKAARLYHSGIVAAPTSAGKR